MNEDLYELMMDGAFSNKEEFSDFISGATQKEIYSLVTEGAFESFEEFQSIFSDLKKKEDSEVTSQTADTASPTQQVEEESTSVESFPEETPRVSRIEETGEYLAPSAYMPEGRKLVPVQEKEPAKQQEPSDIESIQDDSMLVQEKDYTFTDTVGPEKSDKADVSTLAEKQIQNDIYKQEQELRYKELTGGKTKQEQREIKRKQLESQKDTDQFNEALYLIDDYLLNDEETAAADFNKAFDQSGFYFGEEKAFRNALGITSADGEKIIVEYGTAGLTEEAAAQKLLEAEKKIKDFVSRKRIDSEIAQDISRGVKTGESIAKERNLLTKRDYEKEEKEWKSKLSNFQSGVDEYKKMVKSLSSFEPETEQDAFIYYSSVEKLNALSEKLKKEGEDIVAATGEHDALVGRYIDYEGDKWDWASLGARGISTGVANMMAAGGRIKADASEMLSKWVGSLSGSEEFASAGKMVSEMTRADIDRKKSQFQKSLDYLGTTSEAVAKLQESSIVARGIIGGLQSAPAMILAATTGVGGLTLAAAGLQTYESLDEEFKHFKGFEELPIEEKIAVKGAISLAVGWLERLGINYAISRTGLVSQLIRKATKDLPNDASEFMINNAFKREASKLVKFLSKKGKQTVALGEAMAVTATLEGFTGSSQEAVETGVKYAYNKAKKLEVFKTPETFTEFLGNVGTAGIEEMIGSIFLGGTGHVIRAYSNNKIKELPSESFEIFNKMSSDEKFSSMFSDALKIKIINKEISKEEAQKQLDNYHEAKSLLKEIPKDYTSNQRKEAFELLSEKKKKESLIQGISPALAFPVTEEIKKIDEELKSISSKTDADYVQNKIEVLEAERKKALEVNKNNLNNRFREGSELTVEEFINNDIDKKIAEVKNKEKETTTLKEKATSLMDRAKGIFTKTEKASVQPEVAEVEQTTVEAPVQQEVEQTTVEAPVQQEVEQTTVETPVQPEAQVQEDSEASIKERLESRDKKTFSETQTVGPTGQKRTSKISDITTKDGVQTAIYSNKKGDVDVIISSTGSTQNYAAFYRVYENGKPTNRFTSKMQETVGGTFGKMMRNAQEKLPKDVQWTEAKSVSKDGLRVWNKSKQKGWVESKDANGNIITQEVSLNKAKKAEGEVASDYSTVQTTEKASESQIAEIKKLYPGITAEWRQTSKKGPIKTGEIIIKLPVLEKANTAQQTSDVETTTEVQEEVQDTPLAKTIAEVEKFNLEVDAFIASLESAQQPETETTTEVQEDGQSDTYERRIERINAEYDAKLAALESKQQTSGVETTTATEVEAETATKVEPKTATEVQEEVQEEVQDSKPSKERVDSIVNEIIEKTKKRNVKESTNPKKILNSVLGYLQESKFYQQANDIEREAAVREVNKRLGIKIKTPPSAKKITGAPKRTKVTVDEMAALKDQIRLEAKAAREAKKDVNERRKDLAKRVKDFEKGKNITTAKSQAIINRISKVNLDNDAAVEKLLDYIENQYEVAKIKEETTVSNQKRKRAKKNIKSKIGTAKNTFNTFSKLFSYDAKLITDEALKKKYEAILGRFGDSAPVLSVEELKSEAKIAQEIIDAIEEEYSTFEDLADVFYENQVVEDGKVNFDKTIQSKYVDTISEKEESVFTVEQAKILEKYKNKLDITEKKEPATEAEKEAERKELITEAAKADVKNNVTDNEQSRKSAAKLIKLAKNPDNLAGLTDNQLKSLGRIFENINNGIFTSRANTIMNELDAKENADVVTKQLNKARAMAIESIVKGLTSKVTKNTSAYNQIASNALKDIDTILGLKGNEVYSRTFKRMGSAFASFQEATRLINEELTNVNTELTKEFKNENKIVEAKFRIQAYMLQLEYENNPDLRSTKDDNTGTVFTADEWIDETIKALKVQEKQATIDILENVKKQVKGKKAENILSEMSEVEQDAVKVIKKINEDTADKALYVGSVVRGTRPEMIKEYVHHDVMRSNKSSKKEVKDYHDNATNVKTKAGTTEGRIRGVKPINMDALNSTMRGTKQTLLDFYVTNEHRVIKKTLSKVKEGVEGKSERARENKVLKLAEITPQEFAVAMEEAYDEAMMLAFGNAYSSSTVIDRMVSLGYQAQLASVPRAMAEFTSNLGFAMIANPKLFTEGSKQLIEMGVPKAIEYMTLSGSSEMAKFTGAKNTGKSIDMLAKNPDLKKAEGRNAVSNAMKTARNNKGVRAVEKTAETLADFLISTPDKAISLPIWVGTFTNAMKESGVDLAKFESSQEYRTEKSTEIEAARNKADEQLNKAAGSQNAFAGVLKNKINKQKDSAIKQAYKYTNGYLTNFLIFEYSTAREGIIALTRGGDITRAEGLALLGATTTRMASYSLLYKVFASLFFGAFGAEDEQEDEFQANDVTRAIVGSAASLFLGRNFGTFARKGLNMGTEFLNKEYGQVLRGDEEYDSFEHGLGLAYFNPTVEDIKRGKMPEKIIKEISGPLSNHAGLIFNMLKQGANYFDAKNEQQKSEALDYLLNQAAFETVGLFTGKIPLFKDLKKGLYQIPTNNEFAIKEKQFSYKEMKSENAEKYSIIDQKFNKLPRIKQIDKEIAKRKLLLEKPGISKEKTERANFMKSTLEKDKKDLKRKFFDKNFGMKEKGEVGKITQDVEDNGKTLEQELAEIEIADEKTYSEYKRKKPYKYKAALITVKRNRKYLSNKIKMKDLKNKIKYTKNEDKIITLNAKISTLKKANAKIKRDIFNKMFK